MHENSIKKNVIINTLYQVLILIVPFITAPYVSRVVGSDGIGIYSFTLSVQTYFSMFAALGTLAYGAREIARNRKDVYKRSLLFWEIELLTIITSSICIIVWLIFIGNVSDYKIYYLILTLNLINTMLDISWFYNGMEQFKYTIIKNSLFKVLGVILIFVFVKTYEDLSKYIGIMSITTLLGTLSMWMYLPRFLCKISIKDLKIKKHFKETLVYFIPTIATSIYTILDKTLLGLITKNNAENGYYEQATKIINMLKALTFTAINTVLGARISFLFTEDKKEEIRTRINKSINYILFLGIGMMFGIIIVSDLFVPIFFGTGFEKVSGLLKCMSPMIIIIGISNCLGAQYYTPAGLRKQSACYVIIGAIINLVLNLILIPYLWSYGAIIASLIAETVITILYILNCNNYIGLRDIIRYSFKKFIAGIVMICLVNCASIYITDNLLGLLLQIFFGMLVYCFTLLILKDEFCIEIINIILKGKRRGDNCEKRV